MELTTVGLGGTTDVAALSCDLQDDSRTVIRARLRSRPVTFTLGLPGAFNVRNAITALAMVEATGGDVVRRPPGSPTRRSPGGCSGSTWGRTRRWSTSTSRSGRCAGGGGGVAATDRRARLRWRPGPGQAAADGRRGGQHADLVVVTDDNPRSEDPAAIRAEVLAEAQAATGTTDIVDGGDRRSAIRLALQQARRATSSLRFSARPRARPGGGRGRAPVQRPGGGRRRMGRGVAGRAPVIALPVAEVAAVLGAGSPGQATQ